MRFRRSWRTGGIRLVRASRNGRPDVAFRPSGALLDSRCCGEPAYHGDDHRYIIFGSLRWLGLAAVAACVVLFREGHPRQALVLAVALAGSIPIENGIKLLSGSVQRPAAFFNYAEPSTYSFPSGHAFFSTSFYGTLGYISARLAGRRTQRVVIWLSASASIALICLSRVYLGVHYPTDVAGGVLIACFWMNAILTFVKLP